MERFLKALLKQAPLHRLLQIAPPSMTTGSYVDDPQIAETFQRLGAQYQAVAQKLGTAFLDANGWNVELTYDVVHFSECGHRAFSVEIGKRL